jgi:hypothetical protein
VAIVLGLRDRVGPNSLHNQSRRQRFGGRHELSTRSVFRGGIGSRWTRSAFRRNRQRICDGTGERPASPSLMASTATSRPRRRAQSSMALHPCFRPLLQAPSMTFVLTFCIKYGIIYSNAIPAVSVVSFFLCFVFRVFRIWRKPCPAMPSSPRKSSARSFPWPIVGSAAGPSLRSPPPQAPTRQQRPALRPTGNQKARARLKAPSPTRSALSIPCSPLRQPPPAVRGRLSAAGYPRPVQLLNRRSHQAHRTAQRRTAQHRTAQDEPLKMNRST